MRLRPILDSWKFWVIVAYLGLGGVTIALWVNYSRVSSDQARTARVVAARTADIDAQYQQCIQSIPLAKRINRFIHGVQDVHAVLLQNALGVHAITPTSSPGYRQQLVNIRRLRRSLIDTRSVHIQVVTRRQCLAARNRRIAAAR